MKKVLLFIVAAMLLQLTATQTYAQKNKSKKELKAEAKAAADSIAALEASLVDGAQITFKFTEHNFGSKEYDSDISYDFEFINTGKTDLIVTNVTTSCGCTTSAWTREPVPSKSKGKISVKYDSKRVGNFSKTITVHSNAKNTPEILSIKGNVTPKQQ